MNSYPVVQHTARNEAEAKKHARKMYPEKDTEPVIVNKVESVFKGKYIFTMQIRPINQKGIGDF